MAYGLEGLISRAVDHDVNFIGVLRQNSAQNFIEDGWFLIDHRNDHARPPSAIVRKDSIAQSGKHPAQPHDSPTPQAKKKKQSWLRQFHPGPNLLHQGHHSARE
jgi:hypothetical protein